MVKEVRSNLQQHWITYMLIAAITSIGSSIGTSLASRANKIAELPERMERMENAQAEFQKKVIDDMNARTDERHKNEQAGLHRDEAMEARLDMFSKEHAQIRQALPEMIERLVEKGRRLERAK